MVERQLSKNEVIFRQGDWGDEFYQVLEGRVRITYDLGNENDLLLTDLGAGAFFGEMGIIENCPRSASAVAMEDGTRIQVISQEETAEYLEKDPEKALLLMDHIGNRIRTLTNDYNEAKSLLVESDKAQYLWENESYLHKLQKHLAFGKA